MQQNESPFQPELWVYANSRTKTAVVAGFDMERVKDSACTLVCSGYVPVSDEYTLMEHGPTGLQEHFRKIDFIHTKP
jgi:hypothetical protein